MRRDARTSVTTTKLLVSVRDANEALAALDGGADVIDIKEPRRGALGPAPEVWHATAACVAGRRPVSAALGELLQWRAAPLPRIPEGITWVKFGLAGAGQIDWRKRWQRVIGDLPRHVRPVLVAYADWKRAEAPAWEEVAAFAQAHVGMLLIDTWAKDGTDLWDYLDAGALAQLAGRCRQHECRLAVGGSLSLATIPLALRCRCEWVAVRGAACEGDRTDAVSAARVERLKECVSSYGSRSDL